MKCPDCGSEMEWVGIYFEILRCPNCGNLAKWIYE